MKILRIPDCSNCDFHKFIMFGTPHYVCRTIENNHMNFKLLPDYPVTPSDCPLEDEEEYKRKMFSTYADIETTTAYDLELLNKIVTKIRMRRDLRCLFFVEFISYYGIQCFGAFATEEGATEKIEDVKKHQSGLPPPIGCGYCETQKVKIRDFFPYENTPENNQQQPDIH